MKKVLIIEDELAYVRLLSDKLKDSYQVLDAANGKLGLEMAKKHKPDLILLDNIMPEMDGMTMLSELRKDPYGKTAKMIILTNLEANSTIIMQTVQTQPVYYFVKSDTNLNGLIEKIKELLSEKQIDSQPKNA